MIGIVFGHLKMERGRLELQNGKWEVDGNFYTP